MILNWIRKLLSVNKKSSVLYYKAEKFRLKSSQVLNQEIIKI